MKKLDLKDGMVVEYRDGQKRMVFKDKLISAEKFNKLEYYTDELINTSKSCELFDIIAVYKPKTIKGLVNMLRDDNLVLIWKRPEEIHWNEIPFGADVLVRDENDQEWIAAKFLSYKQGNYYPFEVYVDNKCYQIRRQCKLKEVE